MTCFTTGKKDPAFSWSLAILKLAGIMITMKSVLIIIFSFVVPLASLSGSPAATKAPGEIVFRWALVYKVQGDSVLRVMDNTEPLLTLTAKDSFRLFFQPVSEGYVYLFDFNAEEELQLLFPPAFIFFDKGYERLTEYYIPAKNKWFVVDGQAGVEKIYFIVSAVRLARIEKLTNDYLAALDSGDTSRNRLAKLQQYVIDELESLMKKESVFKGEAESPYAVAGEWRAPDGGTGFKAIEVKAKNFYAKKIRIKH